MNAPRRFFLALLLSILLIGLAAHSLPANSLCACIESSGKTNGALVLDACLVCQLQTGVLASFVLPVLPDNESPGANNSAGLPSLDYAAKITHPPIRF